MQATIDASSLKPFTKALTCLSRYGEDLCIVASPSTLTLSTANSSKSAYCRFAYDRQFFSRYNVGSVNSWVNGVEEVLNSTGQLLTKSLLSILKHRTVEKSVERCELSIIEGAQDEGDSEEDFERDSLESRLIVRLHCKHGVVKTHKLLLSTATHLMSPSEPDGSNETTLTIGPRALRDILEHFSPSRGAKHDPQLIWTFKETEVTVKTLKSSLDLKVNTQLTTELTISSEEFDIYLLYAAPTVLVFHLREFNATIAFAESLSLPMELRFTDTAEPLFMDVEADNCNALFVVSTGQIQAQSGQAAPSQQTILNPRKRQREGEDGSISQGADNTGGSPGPPRFKKPMKAAKAVDMAMSRSFSATGTSRSRTSSHTPDGEAPRSSRQRAAASSPHSLSQQDMDMEMDMMPPSIPGPSLTNREPLFLPDSSQNGAGANAFDFGMDDDATFQPGNDMEGEGESLDVMEFSPTQDKGSEKSDDQLRHTFRPLFED